ncbi:hypothetical protein IJJ05_02425 [Candidatus Saccharibacteria bacterium]|nr:hypothetical protein [Candidatus Saccharibacteria bacterium]
MKKEKKSVEPKHSGTKLKIWQLILLFFVVVFGSLLFVMGVRGWFDNNKLTLDAEYYCEDTCNDELLEISAGEYEKLIEEKKSFVIFVDQNGCTTADRLRNYVIDWAREAKVRVYKIMFMEAKATSLHDYVKYYPSVAMISKGKVVAWLRADSDEDAEVYNNYEAFRSWVGQYLILNRE